MEPDPECNGFINNETIALHATDADNLVSIIRNGFGGHIGSGAGGVFTPVHQDKSYITRHLGAAIEYAYQTFPDNPMILVLKWTNTGVFEYDEDEGVGDDVEDMFLANRQKHPYYRSNFAVPGSNLQVIYAYKLPIGGSPGMGFDPTNTWTGRPYGYNPTKEPRIAYGIYFATGLKAIEWLDKHATLIYNTTR